MNRVLLADVATLAFQAVAAHHWELDGMGSTFGGKCPPKRHRVSRKRE